MELVVVKLANNLVGKHGSIRASCRSPVSDLCINCATLAEPKRLAGLD